MRQHHRGRVHRGHSDEDVSSLTQVVLLHLADVAVQRTVSKQHQHGGAGTLLDRRHDMGRVSHHSVLVLGDLGAEEDPGLVLDVEDPQLAGHVSRRVDLSPVHVDLPLGEKATFPGVSGGSCCGSHPTPAGAKSPPQKVAKPCGLATSTSALLPAHTLALPTLVTHSYAAPAGF